MNKLFVAALKEETVCLNYFYHVGVGKINATYNLIKLIQEHKPSEIINYGTAGAIKKELSGIKDKPYVVFHDAYQYFETSFNLNAVGSVALEGDIASSPKQISFLKDKIVKLKASCVFQEPQFDSKLVKIVVEGTNAQIGTLDPLGVNVKSGENFYLQLLKNMAKSLKDCLG